MLRKRERREGFSLAWVLISHPFKDSSKSTLPASSKYLCSMVGLWFNRPNRPVGEQLFRSILHTKHQELPFIRLLFSISSHVACVYCKSRCRELTIISLQKAKVKVQK